MSIKRYLISSLAAAGFVKAGMGEAMPALGDNAEAARPPLEPAIFNLFAQEHLFNLADHRSHSSHASHSSHRSGSSGYSSYYSPPAAVPVYRAPVYTAPAPSPPAAPVTLKGNSQTFISIVRQVQLGLHSYGYYAGTIDGVVGADTRLALTRFQTDYDLKVTGTVTPQVLDTLRISAR